jgi:hypothetical protein
MSLVMRTTLYWWALLPIVHHDTIATQLYQINQVLQENVAITLGPIPLRALGSFAEWRRRRLQPTRGSAAGDPSVPTRVAQQPLWDGRQWSWR